MAFGEKLKERIGLKQTLDTPLFGMKDKVLDTVREEVGKLKIEIMQEMRRILEEKIGSDGITTLKGERGFTPQRGIDYLTMDEIKQIKEELRPVKGRDYFDGKKGPKGDDGITKIITKDGSPDRPQEIADKLNTLKEVIEIDVIKGLTTEIRKLYSSQKTGGGGGGGGGMGLPVPQTFSGDNATTSFTLTSKVAAGGRAIWVFYNGQYLVPTTHFTVTDKTLALTFAPESGTSIDVLYFRA